MNVSFLVLKEHPYGREMLAQLLRAMSSMPRPLATEVNVHDQA